MENTSDVDVGEAYSDAQPDCSVDAPKDLPDVIEHTCSSFVKVTTFFPCTKHSNQ